MLYDIHRMLSHFRTPLLRTLLRLLLPTRTPEHPFSLLQGAETLLPTQLTEQLPRLEGARCATNPQYSTVGNRVRSINPLFAYRGPSLPSYRVISMVTTSMVTADMTLEERYSVATRMSPHHYTTSTFQQRPIRLRSQLETHKLAP
jgi:hypothetical protein